MTDRVHVLRPLIDPASYLIGILVFRLPADLIPGDLLTAHLPVGQPLNPPPGWSRIGATQHDFAYRATGTESGVTIGFHIPTMLTDDLPDDLAVVVMPGAALPS